MIKREHKSEYESEDEGEFEDEDEGAEGAEGDVVPKFLREPAEWSVVARHPTKGIVYDFKRQRKVIAEGLKLQWERRGFVVDVVYVKESVDESKPSTEQGTAAPPRPEERKPEQEDPYANFAIEMGRLLRRCREADGLSLAEMCRKLQSVERWDRTVKVKSVSGLSRIETGNVKMTMAQLAVFAEVFELKPSEFIRLAEVRVGWPAPATGSTSTSSAPLLSPTRSEYMEEDL